MVSNTTRAALRTCCEIFMLAGTTDGGLTAADPDACAGVGVGVGVGEGNQVAAIHGVMDACGQGGLHGADHGWRVRRAARVRQHLE
jgi:hypothetical protein